MEPISLRQESIDTLKDAFNRGILGMQMGATACVYYNRATDSCCAVGQLIRHFEGDEKFFDMAKKDSDIKFPFAGSTHFGIRASMASKGMLSLYGLSYYEMERMQLIHDRAINHTGTYEDFQEFLTELDNNTATIGLIRAELEATYEKGEIEAMDFDTFWNREEVRNAYEEEWAEQGPKLKHLYALIWETCYAPSNNSCGR